MLSMIVLTLILVKVQGVMNIVIPYSAPVPSHRKQHACDCLLKALILQQRKSLFFRERELVRKLCKMKIVVVNSNLYTGNAVVEQDQLLKTTYITSIIWCTCGFMISCYIIVNIVNISGVPAGL